jgi:hypothetical protein
MKFLIPSIFLASLSILASCQVGGGSLGAIQGNEGGSEPVNDQEAFEMQKAVNRCHRSGGTRVVKLRGHLRCY